MRAADFPDGVRALGIDAPWTISRTFQGAPIRRRGVDVGHFLLAEKADGEAFADQDEEVPALFVSQAASAIVNARAHRSEQRARAELETPVQSRWRSWSRWKWSKPRSSNATFDRQTQAVLVMPPVNPSGTCGKSFVIPDRQF